MRPVRRPVGQGVKLRGPISGLAPAESAASASDDPPAALPAASAVAEPPDCPAVPTDLVTVGRIVDSYGVRGWVKVEAYNDTDDSVLGRVRRWWVRPSSAARGPSLIARAVTPVLRDIERVRSHGGILVAKPVGSEDRDSAIELKGFEVLASRADFPAGEDGEYYWGDLIGCQVGNPAGQALGRVFAVEDYGAHPILRLEVEGGPERMIPFVSVYIVSVDLPAKHIVADWSPDY